MSRFRIGKQRHGPSFLLFATNTNTSQLRAVCLLPPIVSPFVPCSVIRCDRRIANSSASAIASLRVQKERRHPYFRPSFFSSTLLASSSCSYHISSILTHLIANPYLCNCQPTTIPEDLSYLADTPILTLHLNFRS